MRDSAFNSHDHVDALPPEGQFADWQQIEALNNELEDMMAELREVKEDRDSWEKEARSQRMVVERQTFDVMARVREWFHDRILAKRDVPKNSSARPGRYRVGKGVTDAL